MRQLVVKAEWDAEAEVWYVAESDVPGLAAEGANLEELLAKLRIVVPELVELNAHLIEGDLDRDLPIRLVAERIESCAPAA